MRCEVPKHATSNVRGDFTSTSSRNCKQTRDLKGDKGTASCLPCSCELVKQNSSPLVSLLNKKKFANSTKLFCKFKKFIHSQELTTKIWLRLQLSPNFRAEITRSWNFKICWHLSDLKSYFANFKTLLTRLSNLLNLEAWYASSNFKIWQEFLIACSVLVPL